MRTTYTVLHNAPSRAETIVCYGLLRYWAARLKLAVWRLRWRFR